MQRTTFQQSMLRLASAFSVEITPEKAEVYWEELGHVDDVVFLAATKRALAEWDKPFALPPIATLLRFVKHASGALGGAASPLDAWGQFRRKLTLRLNLDLLSRSPEDECRRVGLTSVELDCARRLGGLAHLAQMTPKDLDWKAKEFVQVYTELAERHDVEDALMAIEPARVPLLAEGDES